MNDSQINFDALDLKFIHSAGPGGQNVNKVATAVQLRYDLSLAGLSEMQLARLTALVPGQISRDGFLILTARNHRGQALNRAEALARLEELLRRAKAPPPRPRKATSPTRRSAERRLAGKKRRAAHKSRRRAVGPGDDD